MLEALALERLLQGYVDARLASNLEFLIILFLMMLVMGALEISGTLSAAGQHLASWAGTERRLALALCIFVFISAAFLTNDVVLLGIVPLTVLIGVSSRIDVKKIVIFEGIAANAGSLLTPFGNPQNMYIAVCYKIAVSDFIMAMLPLWLVSLGLIVIIVHFSSETRTLHRIYRKRPHWGMTVLALVSLSIIILYFFHMIPAIIAALLVLMFLVWTYRLGHVLRSLDYKLFALFVIIALVTYAALRIWTVGLSGYPLFFSAIGLSQVFSNVPATFILSGTTEWRILALGVNIGGSGTLIASIATLIAFRYAKKYDHTISAWDFMKWGALFCLLQISVILPLIFFTRVV